MVALAVLGGWLDWMISEGFSNQNDSVIPCPPGKLMGAGGEGPFPLVELLWF